jgi:hypothetical protein
MVASKIRQGRVDRRRLGCGEREGYVVVHEEDALFAEKTIAKAVQISAS